MTSRRGFLRWGALTSAALVIPDEKFVRKFFPVGIDLGPSFNDWPPGVTDIGWCHAHIDSDALVTTYDTSGLPEGAYRAKILVSRGRGVEAVEVGMRVLNIGSAELPVLVADHTVFQQYWSYGLGVTPEVARVHGVRYG